MDVVIEDVDPNGRYIRLANKGNEDFRIGAWCIKSTADDLEIMFKFHSRTSIKPNKSITVSYFLHIGHKHGSLEIFRCINFLVYYEKRFKYFYKILLN